MSARRGSEPVAIVGIGCRFPGDICSAREFWQLLCDRGDAIDEVPPDRWDVDALFSPDPTAPGLTYARRGGFLTGIDQFDPEFFGISPREAAYIDPQQRLLLETAHEAMEDAGERWEDPAIRNTGVFVGVFIHDYQHMQFNERRALSAHTGTGTAMSITANRISYVFDLHGPSVAVDTACSSSLVAIDLARKALLNGDCDFALAGGVNVILKPEMTIAMSKATMLSPDGACKSFDARANGYVRGEGAGLVMLRRLSEAQAAGNRIYAVLIGSGVNSDGATNGISVPNGLAQEALSRRVLAEAGVPAASVGYVEAHGTGTPVGDPIEANALGRVFSEGRADGDVCLVGSVKSNIGHLESASGVAGLIKAALCVHHGEIPSNLHFERANPAIDFPALKLKVADAHAPWPAAAGPRRAAVNSFGFGGTNAHVLIEQAPPDEPAGELREAAVPALLLPAGAHAEAALRGLAAEYARVLGEDESRVRDLIFTVSQRRSHGAVRAAFLGADARELRERLEQFASGARPAGCVTGERLEGFAGRPTFVFTGMGPQWWAMGRELLVGEPVFRRTVHEIDRAFREIAGWSIVDCLLDRECDSRIQQTDVAQPAIFALQAGLVALWKHWGIEPGGVIGHSVGEIAALHAAGVLSLEDAAKVAYHRSRLQRTTAGSGGMLAAGLAPEAARELIAGFEDHVSIGAVNAAASITLSGDVAVLERLREKLEANGTFARKLNVEVPYHSQRMEPIRAELLESLRELRPSDPRCPYYSTTDVRTERGRLGDAGYWWRNVRQTVQFAAAVERAVEDGQSCFLEIGPHPVLRASLLECLQGARGPTRVVSTLRRAASDWESLGQAVAELHVAGAPLCWDHIVGTGRLLALRPYPWQRTRHWAETKEAEQQRQGLSDGTGLTVGGSRHPLLGGKLDVPPTTWLRVLRLEDHPYLRDHRIQGGIVFPGTGYLETALQTLAEDEAASLDPQAGEYLLLADVEIGRALHLNEGEEVRLQTTRTGDRWEVRACSGQERTWLRHAWGRARREKFFAVPARLDLAAVLERCTNELPTDYAYRLFGDVGLGYGPAFQCIDELHYGTREAIARLKNRAPSPERSDAYFFHPALLDACLHTIFGALNLNGEDSHRRGNVFLPVGARQVRVYGRPGDEVWSHARIHRAASEYFVADVLVYDADRRLLAEVLDLRCQALEPEDAVAERRKQQWMVEYQWVPAPLKRPAVRPQPGVWLVLAPARDCELIRQLELRGQKCIAVLPGEGFRAEGSGFAARPTVPEDLARVVAEVFARGVPLRGIAHAWCTRSSDDGLWETEEQGAIGLIHLAQALEAELARAAKEGGAAAGEGRAARPPLWIFTLGTQPVAAEDSVHVAHASVWGLRRVLANESPSLGASIIDVDGWVESWFASADELLAGSREDELAFRRGERHVHRLRRYVPGEAELAAPGGAAEASDYTELRVTRPGDLSSLAWVEMPSLELGPDEVEIEVHAAGLNFKDVLKAAGLFPVRLMEGNLWSRDTLGMECAGRVVRVGAHVEDLAPGAEVLALAPRAFASRVVTRHELVVPNPGLAPTSAAGIPVAFLTAAVGLEVLAGLKAGERVLIHAGTGGVGQAAIQIAQQIGAEIFATAGSPDKRALLRELGVLHVFDSRSLRFAEEIREVTDGEGVDVVLNSLAGEAIPASLGALRDYGRFVELGKLDLDRDFPLGLRPFTRCISFHALDLDRMLAQRVALCGEVLRSIAQRVRDGRLRSLPVTVHEATAAAGAFETMATATHTGKLVVALDPGRLPVRNAQSMRFRKDASYLVTGGLGGFGLQLARWLAVHGAGHLLLLGRRGRATPGADAALRSLESLGATVQIEACDVADSASVEAVLARVPAERPLRGVFHAAAVLDDALVKNLDVERYRRTFGPKATGAWNLHLRTRTLPLDHFMCFSSMASILGNQGSGNYCAANAFVDALAHHRRSLGLPALTVNWGVIADVGMAADEDFYRQNLERNGLQTIHSGHCLELLGLLMREGRVQTTVCPIDWTTWVRFNPAGSEGRLVELLKAGSARTEGRSQSTAELALRKELDALAGAEREARACRVVAELLAAVLRMDVERLDPNRSLTALGVDSLLGIEIKNRLDKLGLAISVTQLLSRESAGTLAARLLGALGYGGEGEPVSERVAVETSDASPFIVREVPRESAKLRLVCFPYAGGGPAVYQRWSDALPEAIEVVSIDFRQRDVALASGLFRSIDEAADAISAALVPLLDRPFALFGHCMGAIVMYEVAWRLQERHGSVAQHLFVSGCMAPHLYNSPLVHEQDERSFLDILHLISFSGTRALLDDDELRKDLFPGLRRDFEAVALYGDGFRMRAPLAAPITGIAASDDLFAAPKAMRAWDRYSAQRYDLALLSGDHYFVETQRQAVTRLVASRLGLDGADSAAAAADAGLDWILGARSGVEDPPCRVEGTQQPRAPQRSARARERARVLCFPPVGVRAADFAACLGSAPDIAYEPVEWNDCAAPPARTVEEIVERLRPRLEAGPPALFYGHCLGGIVAYELALRLQREGAPLPDHLIVAGAVGPHLYVAPDAYRLPTPKLVELLRVLRFPGSESLRDDGKASEDTLERVRADLEAMARYDYRSGSLLDVPITAISLRHDLWSYPRRADSWQLHTARECRVVEWSGDHYHAMRSPEALTELMREIAKAE
jgi:acyl transferase domain-containing protein/surfactin synthase thioesterase subunit/NADPH:quinone reductase-like Zn-dependent oxidoreductase/NAD(P)-dependent dehydrogenase (short-subunit alcohol dehydrogenase family)